MSDAGGAVGWGEAILLGILQGLTEFLPISSSAHLRVFGPLLPSGGDPGAAFTAITQLGTEAAVLVYFRREILAISRSWWRSVVTFGRHADQQSRLGWLIGVGTLPIGILGLVFQSSIETTLRDLHLTATMLIVFALVLWFADRNGRRVHDLDRLDWRHGLLFGLAQAMALIPGVSRSGGTITAGLLLGYTRDAAARYSFLLAIPAVVLSGFYQLWKSIGVPTPVATGPTVAATVVSFFVGYAVIVAFLRYVTTRSYAPFVAYRIVLGVAVLVLLQAGVLSAT